MIFPPMLMARLNKTKLLESSAKLRMLTEIGVVTIMVRLQLDSDIVDDNVNSIYSAVRCSSKRQISTLHLRLCRV